MWKLCFCILGLSVLMSFLDAGVGLGVLSVVILFMIILAIGLLYDIKKGGLEFD